MNLCGTRRNAGDAGRADHVGSGCADEKNGNVVKIGGSRSDLTLFSCIGNEPKSGLARDLGDCLQSRNVPFGTSGDFHRTAEAPV